MFAERFNKEELALFKSCPSIGLRCSASQKTKPNIQPCLHINVSINTQQTGCLGRRLCVRVGSGSSE
jgi:hypothetical protein